MKLAEPQLTSERAKALLDSKIWEDWTPEQIVDFQLFQEMLGVPFSVFHKAMQDVLKRPVWTHEFAFADLLQQEYLGERPMPTFQEILDLIPEEKRIIIQPE